MCIKISSEIVMITSPVLLDIFDRIFVPQIVTGHKGLNLMVFNIELVSITEKK